MKVSSLPLMLVMLTASAFSLKSAYADDAAEMAKKLQNPLANIKAIMTDNVIGFDSGTTEDTSFGFQIQPVYAIDIRFMGVHNCFDFHPAKGQPSTVCPRTDTVYQSNLNPFMDY